VRCNVSRTDRRRFLRGGVALVSLGVLSGCGIAVPQARPPAKVPRLGILGNFPSAQWDALLAGLAELGYVDGQTLAIEARWSEGLNDRFPALVAELINLSVDVIAVSSVAGLLAAKDQTTAIPIVSAGAFNDPVGPGWVASLARPGGNITGLTGETVGVTAKRLELLKEAAPATARVALLQDRTNSLVFARVQEAGQKLGIHVLELPTVAAPGEFDAAFGAAIQARTDALLVDRAPLFVLHRGRILDFVAQRRLPAIFGLREFVDDGALLFYATNLPAVFRRAASHVDKILKGTKPGDIPIEQPTTFDFVVNLKTARALGLTIPPPVLQQATEVIQ